MNSTISHHLKLMLRKTPSCPTSQPTPSYKRDMTSYGMEYLFGQFGSAVPAVSPPSFLGAPRLCVSRAV